MKAIIAASVAAFFLAAQPSSVCAKEQWNWQTANGSAPSEQTTSVGFSPEGTGISLVLYGIHSARRSIHVMAYVLSNHQIIGALAEQARRGVEVRVVVDYKENIAEDRDGYIQRGLAYLARSGAQVCSVNRFRIMHDKVMVLDGVSVQTGSINYTEGGANANSENALILWNYLNDARDYEQHFQSRLALCQPL